MIETENLILDKAKFLDWKEMYHNVWSQPESARYMDWSITTSEEAAKIDSKDGHHYNLLQYKRPVTFL